MMAIEQIAIRDAEMDRGGGQRTGRISWEAKDPDLHRLPETGESINALGWRIEVVDLDSRRIDKVIATRLPSLRRKRMH